MRLKKFFMNPLFAFSSVIVAMALYFIACYLIRFSYGPYDLDQSGATDALTYLFYGMAFSVLMCFYKDYMHTPRQKNYLGLVFLWFVALLREMGVQHWLAINDTTAFKLNYFKNPEVPFYGKMLSAIIILAVVFVISYMLFKNIKKMVRGFFKLDPVYWTIAAFGGLGILTQISDRFNSHYAKYTGERLSEPVRFFLKIIEEGGESLLPLIFIIALVQFHLQLKKDAD